MADYKKTDWDETCSQARSNKPDTRTDAEVMQEVEFKAGEHYDIVSDALRGGVTHKAESVGYRSVVRVSNTEEDIPQKGQGNYLSLRHQLKDYTTNFYGPSLCEGCGRCDVIRSEMYTHRAVTSWEEYEITGGASYSPHHCTHLKLFKGLAGKVLTIIDASLVTNPKQHKAVCDLLRKAFAETIGRARELEGDHGSESSSEGLA